MRELDPTTDTALFGGLKVPKDSPPYSMPCAQVVVWVDEKGDGKKLSIYLLESHITGDFHRLTHFWEIHRDGTIAEMAWYNPEGVRMKFLTQ